MPRRVRPKPRRSALPPPEPIEDEPTFEDMARALVEAGTCSPLILDRPRRPLTDLPDERTNR